MPTGLIRECEPANVLGIARVLRAEIRCQWQFLHLMRTRAAPIEAAGTYSETRLRAQWLAAEGAKVELRVLLMIRRVGLGR